MRDPVRPDQGSMLAFTMLVGLAITSAIALALMPLLVDLMHRQQAQSAADAAALAGTTGGREAAARLASANDAVLVGWNEDGHEVTVRVQVGDQLATARATDAP